jgi:hypothetical protein
MISWKSPVCSLLIYVTTAIYVAMTATLKCTDREIKSIVLSVGDFGRITLSGNTGVSLLK